MLTNRLTVFVLGQVGYWFPYKFLKGCRKVVVPTCPLLTKTTSNYMVSDQTLSHILRRNLYKVSFTPRNTGSFGETPITHHVFLN